MLRRTVAPIALALLLVTTAACGGESADTSTDGAGPGAEEAATTTTTTEPSPDTAAPGFAAFEELEPGCLHVVGALPAPEPSSPADLLGLAIANRLAPAPLAGLEGAAVAEQVRASSIDEFFQVNTNIIEPEERRQAMERAGFVGFVDNVFLTETGRQIDVSVIQFESAEGARDYYDLHLRRICRDATGVAGTASPVGGIRYIRQSGTEIVPRAVALVGNTEVAVSLCHCVEGPGLSQLAERWLAAILLQAVGGQES